MISTMFDTFYKHWESRKKAEVIIIYVVVLTAHVLEVFIRMI